MAWVGLELFHHDIRAFLTHETTTTPTPSDLMRRHLPARPTPDRFKTSEEVGILLQGRHEKAEPPVGDC
jgi:hypothetical protein